MTAPVGADATHPGFSSASWLAVANLTNLAEMVPAPEHADAYPRDFAERYKTALSLALDIAIAELKNEHMRVCMPKAAASSASATATTKSTG